MSYTRADAHPFPLLTNVMKTLESVQNRQQINASILFANLIDNCYMILFNAVLLVMPEGPHSYFCITKKR